MTKCKRCGGKGEVIMLTVNFGNQGKGYVDFNSVTIENSSDSSIHTSIPGAIMQCIECNGTGKTGSNKIDKK